MSPTPFPVLRLLALLWLLVGLSCNFPVSGTSPEPGASGRSLAQTLAALPSPGVDPATPPPQPATAIPSPTPVEPGATPFPFEPGVTPFPSPPPLQPTLEGPYFIYTVQPGDTLLSLGGRFAVELPQILPELGLPPQSLLPHGVLLTIPNMLDEVTPGALLLPDHELVFSPASLDFDLVSFIQQSDGYLSRYSETLPDGKTLSGAEIFHKVVAELSVNPRLLLVLLELRSGWVYGEPLDPLAERFPFGFQIAGRSGLYQELTVAATQLNLAYYGWRKGTFTEIRYPNGVRARLNPALNPASVAVQHFFAMFHRLEAWMQVLYDPGEFPQRYRAMFADPWERAAIVGPLFPPGLTQPPLELPFLPGEMWSLTAGPHFSWNAGTPRGALDFSPVTGEAVCAVSRAWARASAPGVVVRAADNALVLDLDGDGYEQTGWTLFYYHLAEEGLAPAGARVALDDPLGHPSCEGGRSTGKHVHIARKYNGEWLEADGPLPFILSGWRVLADSRNYHGALVKGDQVVSSDPGGGRSSSIQR